MSPQEAERRRRFSRASVKHGLYKTPEYNAWLAMRPRCSNPKHPCFKHYGARGITVCDRWNSFENFIADMGQRPTDKHELERKDNDAGYSPGNCVWATRPQQMRNTRRTLKITIDGRTLCLKDWCSEFGKKVSVVKTRIYTFGWDPIRALTE